MLKYKCLTQCLAIALFSSFNVNVYAEDFYFTQPGIQKIILKHGEFSGISNINISNSAHFELSHSDCDPVYNPGGSCAIDIQINETAAANMATLNYQVTDLISGEVASISKTLEAAPVMYQLQSAEVEYNEESNRYRLASGDNHFTLKVIGGFNWYNPAIDVNTDVADVSGDCTGTINRGDVCHLILTPRADANDLQGRVDSSNAITYQPIDVEVVNEINEPEILKIAPALTRIKLSASQGKVENIDISEFMTSDFIEFSTELSTCMPDEYYTINLNDGDSCYFFIHQKPATFERSIGEYVERLAIKTPAKSHITEMRYNGYLLLGDNDGQSGGVDARATVFLYNAVDGEINYVTEKMLNEIIEGETIREINQMTANLYGEFYFSNNQGSTKNLYRVNLEDNSFHKLTKDAGSDFWGVATATSHHTINNRPALSTFFLSTKGLVIQEYRYLNTNKDGLLDSESELDLEGDDFYAAGFSAYHNTFYAVEDGEGNQPAQFAVVDIASTNRISSGQKTIQDSNGNGQTNFITLFDPSLGYENGVMMASEDTKYSSRKLFYNTDSDLPKSTWQAISSPNASQLGSGQIALTQVTTDHMAIGGLSGRVWLYNRSLNSSEYGYYAALTNTQTLIAANFKGLQNQGVIAYNEDFGLALFERQGDDLAHRSNYTLSSQLPKKGNKNQMVVTAEIEFSAFNDASRYVFITKELGNGNLSSWADAAGETGILAANKICQADASRRGLSGTYHAWLSDESINAVDNVKSHPEIVYYNLDDSIFAYSHKLITDPTSVKIENAIPQDIPQTDMWTGTRALGTLRTPNCNNWTSDSSSNQGNYGDIVLYDWTPSKWTEFAAQSCGNVAKLYCFEV
ncbi:hypothetical protein [Cysteiniphilum sp. 6C5]|uniref:hypothetical protein n=1 Tax=unclassified Cysteiniphilum TaxID=2610889 RepID=UPI003F834F9A